MLVIPPYNTGGTGGGRGAGGHPEFDVVLVGSDNDASS